MLFEDNQLEALIYPFCAQYPSPLIGLICFVPTNHNQREESSQDPFKAKLQCQIM